MMAHHEAEQEQEEEYKYLQSGGGVYVSDASIPSSLSPSPPSRSKQLLPPSKAGADSSVAAADTSSLGDLQVVDMDDDSFFGDGRKPADELIRDVMSNENGHQGHLRDDQALLRMLSSTGGVLIAFSWTTALQYVFWSLTEKGKVCETLSGERSVSIAPHMCKPSALQHAISFAYASFSTVVCVAIILKLVDNVNDLKRQHRARASWIVFYQLTAIALGLLPGFAWSSAITDFSVAVVGVGGLYLFATFVTIAAITILCITNALAHTERILRSKFLTAEAEAVSVSCGFATAASWTSAVSLTISSVVDPTTQMFAQLIVTLVVSFVVAVVSMNIKFKGHTGSTGRRLFEHVYEEVCGDVIGFTLHSTVVSFLRSVFTAKQPIPPWGFLLYGLCAGFVSFTLTLFISKHFEQVQRAAVADSPPPLMQWAANRHVHMQSRFASQLKRRYIHYLSSALGVVTGLAFGETVKAAFVAISNPTTGIALYFVFAAAATALVVVLVYAAAAVRFSSVFVPGLPFKLTRPASSNNVDGSSGAGSYKYSGKMSPLQLNYSKVRNSSGGSNSSGSEFASSLSTASASLMEEGLAHAGATRLSSRPLGV